MKVEEDTQQSMAGCGEEGPLIPRLPASGAPPSLRGPSVQCCPVPSHAVYFLVSGVFGICDSDGPLALSKPKGVATRAPSTNLPPTSLLLCNQFQDLLLAREKGPAGFQLPGLGCPLPLKWYFLQTFANPKHQPFLPELSTHLHHRILKDGTGKWP